MSSCPVTHPAGAHLRADAAHDVGLAHLRPVRCLHGSHAPDKILKLLALASRRQTPVAFFLAGAR
jgi:hypothetical protein